MSTKHVRYLIVRDEATWLRNYYAVEVNPDADDPENDARDALFEGNYEWLGFDCGDNFENAENPIVSIERTDDMPFVTREPDPPRNSDVEALVEASLAVQSIFTEGAFGDLRRTGLVKSEAPGTLMGIHSQLCNALKPFLTKEDVS